MEVDRKELQKKLARAVLGFQDSFMADSNAPSGLLCQVWLPEKSSNGTIELKTKGMPFCVAGMGDLLALFRCISCRFNFAADSASKPESLGAPGRVFTSGYPELACNVQQYPTEAYLRRAEAEQCRVQSSMLLPVFMLPSTSEPRPSALGVIEVVQTSDDMAFLPVARLLAIVLEKCGLFTSTLQEVQARLPTAATSLELPLRTGFLEPNSTEAGSAEEPGGGAGAGEPASNDTSMQDDPADADYEEGVSYDQEDSASRRRRSPITRAGSVGGRKRQGKMGKPGVKLTLAELQGQFGVGLKEAASALGVCTTTLKRACRRHGIQRWPRRALQKVSRALDEMERRGGIVNAVAGGIPIGALGLPNAGNILLPPGAQLQELPVDSRWAALANMIPTLQNPTDLAMQQAWNQNLPQEQQEATARSRMQAAAPSPSDFSLDGAVAVSNKRNAGDNITVATGMTQWETGTAAGANAAAAAAAFGRPQQQQQNGPNLVPAFLRPDLGDAQRRFESPFASNGQSNSPNDPNEAMLQLPMASMGPGFSLPNLSQLSVPSLNPSFMVLPSSIMGIPNGSGGLNMSPRVGQSAQFNFSNIVAAGGLQMQQMQMQNAAAAPASTTTTTANNNTLILTNNPAPVTITNAAAGGAPAAPAAAVPGANGATAARPAPDDVGLLDSTILELMLSEDSRSLVGATDDDLRKLFPGGIGAAAAGAGQRKPPATQA